ncbi:four helix bundle protein [Candidatus Kuenenbacteria bacterium]|nr:four helix bundle protein [Candidatus Kuenenbacteria bacterium]
MVGKIENFYDLDTWKEAHLLVLKIYKITEQFPAHEIYGITSQIRRASSSITANVAEGFSRYHDKDKIKFYYQARGSISEVQNFLILSRDLGYINTEKCAELGLKAHDVRKLLNGLIRATSNQT